MDWFVYDDGLCHERVKQGVKTCNNIILKVLVSSKLIFFWHAKTSRSCINPQCIFNFLIQISGIIGHPLWWPIDSNQKKKKNYPKQKTQVIRKLIVQENKIENVYWSTTVKIVTSTQFPIKDFLFPRKYKRTLREHQMSNWSHIFIRCHREMKVSSAGSFGGHSPEYLLMKPSNTSKNAPKCQKISNLWRRGGVHGCVCSISCWEDLLLQCLKRYLEKVY